MRCLRKLKAKSMIEIIPTNVLPHMREVMAVPLDTVPPAASVSFKACRETIQLIESLR